MLYQNEERKMVVLRERERDVFQERRERLFYQREIKERFFNIKSRGEFVKFRTLLSDFVLMERIEMKRFGCQLEIEDYVN